MSYTAIYYHLVFSTKERRPYLRDPTVRADTHAYIGGIIRNLSSSARAIGGVADHIHILFRIPNDMALAGAVRTIKTNSSAWIHERWPSMWRFGWQEKYSAFSVSPSAMDRVMSYIDAQESHHARRSFDEELVELLAKNGVQYDARYLFR